MGSIEVYLVEREHEDAENYNHYRNCVPGDALTVDDVLRAFENAMKGFGFVMDGRHLEIVKDN